MIIFIPAALEAASAAFMPGLFKGPRAVRLAQPATVISTSLQSPME